MAIKTVKELKEHWLMLMRKALRGTLSKRAVKELVKGNTTEPTRTKVEPEGRRSPLEPKG